MFRARTSTNILLFIFWLFILGFIALQWLRPSSLNNITEITEPPSDSRQIAVNTQNSPPMSFTIADLEDYQEITERPLFYATRRPPPPEAPEVAVQEEPEEEKPIALTLIGVMVVSDSKIALVQNDDTNKVIRLKPGEEIENWQLQTINANSIVLNKNDETKELPLLRNKRKPSLKTTLRQELQEKREQRRKRIANQQQGQEQEQEQEQEPGQEMADEGTEEQNEQQAEAQVDDNAEDNPVERRRKRLEQRNRTNR